MSSLIVLLRPVQWVKNLLLFAPLFFAGKIFVVPAAGQAALGFLAFCLAASSVYIMNDLADRSSDALHPHKKNRPIASGRVSVAAAGILLAAMIIAVVVLVSWLVPSIAWPLGAYLALNILYSVWLKHVVIFDLLLVAFFYVLRVISGGLVTDTFVSRWLILCTLFVSLFIVIGKRRAELTTGPVRPVLKKYTGNFLDHLLTITVALTIVTYGIYSVLGATSPLVVYSTIFVLVGLFRYLYLIYQSGLAEFPERAVYRDKVILGSVLGWILYMFYTFYA